jgi:putative modified peptide
MNHEELSRLMDLWSGDAAFRAGLRKDPLAAIAQTGLQLSDEDREAVAAIDWSLSDEELVARASHAA